MALMATVAGMARCRAGLKMHRMFVVGWKMEMGKGEESDPAAILCVCGSQCIMWCPDCSTGQSQDRERINHLQGSCRLHLSSPYA